MQNPNLTNWIKSSSVGIYTVLLENKEYSNCFECDIKKRGIIIQYDVKEIGLFQLKGDKETLETLLSENRYVNSYSKSFSYSLTSNMYNNSNSKVGDNFSFKSPTNSLWHLQWDMKRTTFNGQSYNITEGSKNVIVGIIDSGIDINHPDLKENIVRGSKNLVPKGGYNGLEFEETGDPNYLNDLTGHGTFIAGQIAANGKLKGVAPNIGIKSYRVFGSRKSESIWIIKGIIEAAKDGVDVINLSLGEYLVEGEIKSNNGIMLKQSTEIKAYKEAINFANMKGSIIVTSIGNNSLNLNNYDEVEFFLKKNLTHLLGDCSLKGNIICVPADLPGVVTVSSIGPTDKVSLFANYGNSVDLAAYGGDYRYLNRYGKDGWISDYWYRQESIFGTAPNSSYTYNMGTSISAAKVSAAIALLLDSKKIKNYHEAIYYLYKNGIAKDNKTKEGYGILNVYELLKPQIKGIPI